MEGLKTKLKKKKEIIRSFGSHPQNGLFIKIYRSNSTLLASPFDPEQKYIKYFYLCEFYIQRTYWDRYLFHKIPKGNAQYFEVYNWLFRAKQGKYRVHTSNTAELPRARQCWKVKEIRTGVQITIQ